LVVRDAPVVADASPSPGASCAIAPGAVFDEILDFWRSREHCAGAVLAPAEAVVTAEDAVGLEVAEPVVAEAVLDEDVGCDVEIVVGAWPATFPPYVASVALQDPTAPAVGALDVLPVLPDAVGPLSPLTDILNIQPVECHPRPCPTHATTRLVERVTSFLASIFSASSVRRGVAHARLHFDEHLTAEAFSDTASMEPSGALYRVI